MKSIDIGTDIDNRIVVSDVRFQNEIDAIHAKGGFIIKIHRDLPNESLTSLHESESNIDKFVGDYYIENNSSYDDLYKRCNNIMDNIGACD
jgi:hypothetical protein